MGLGYGSCNLADVKDVKKDRGIAIDGTSFGKSTETGWNFSSILTYHHCLGEKKMKTLLYKYIKLNATKKLIPPKI